MAKNYNWTPNIRDGVVFEKTYEAILYPDSEDHDAYGICKEVLDLCVGDRIAYILHDSDFNDDGSPKKAHIHLLMSFRNRRSMPHLCRCFGIPEHLIKPFGSFVDRANYLTHWQFPYKAQYDPDDVVANFDFSPYTGLSKAEIEAHAIRVISNYILDYNPNSSSLLEFVLDNGLYSYYRRSYSIFRDLRSFR